MRPRARRGIKAERNSDKMAQSPEKQGKKGEQGEEEIVVVRGNLKLTRGERNCGETKEWSRIIVGLLNNVYDNVYDLDSMEV